MNPSILRLLLVALAVVWSFVATPSARAQGAAAYAISDNASGHMLESRNAQKKLQIGSLTKIATAMVVLDWAESKGQDLGTEATISAVAERLGNTAGVGFRAGDRCTLRDLLYAALMQSDNPAAQTLAEFVGRALGEGEEPAAPFVAQMNALAGKLGMSRTRFTNAHGLEEGERSMPYSTAEDLVKLSQYAVGRAAFRFYVSQPEKKITINNESGAHAYLLRNTNELVGIDSIDGVKTGTTRRAGPCLIISAARAPESRQEGEKVFITPRRLDVVVLNAPDRFGTSRELLAKGWQLYDAWASAGRPQKKGR